METMSPVKLILRGPSRIRQVTIDPQPDLSFDDLRVELHSLEEKLRTSSMPFKKTYSRDFPVIRTMKRSSKPFVMGVYEDELQGIFSDGEVVRHQSSNALHLNCDGIFLSAPEDSNHELTLQVLVDLKEDVDLVESSLALQTYDRFLNMKEEIRNQLGRLETDLTTLNENSRAAISRIEKYYESRREADRRLDAAIEAERIAMKKAAENFKKIDVVKAQETIVGAQTTKPVNSVGQPKGNAQDGTNVSSSPGSMVRASKSALNSEQERLKKLREVKEGNQALRLSSNKDFSIHEKHIARTIKQIGGTKENVRKKTSELLKSFMDPHCPQTISTAAFAEKVVLLSQIEYTNVPFAFSHIIVLVTSQVPSAMVLFLAELHRAYIYTVPKHIEYSEAAYESKDSYYKTIGFREDIGKMECVENYLMRLEAYMKLYGALIQTEVPGVRNLHGLEEGWAWLTRFLNAVPPNIYTAIALHAFLQVAGFALFRKYKSQFRKLLNIISDNFLSELRGKENIELNGIIVKIEFYLENQKFLQEPEGRILQ